MGFQCTMAEDDIWIKPAGKYYEYIVRYVDDLAIVSENPEAIIKQLECDHKLKLKGTGPISYHLGCDFHRDKHGVLCMSPKSYVKKAIGNYFETFGEMPSVNVWSHMQEIHQPGERQHARHGELASFDLRTKDTHKEGSPEEEKTGHHE